MPDKLTEIQCFQLSQTLHAAVIPDENTCLYILDRQLIKIIFEARLGLFKVLVAGLSSVWKFLWQETDSEHHQPKSSQSRWASG